MTDTNEKALEAGYSSHHDPTTTRAEKEQAKREQTETEQTEKEFEQEASESDLNSPTSDVSGHEELRAQHAGPRSGAPSLAPTEEDISTGAGRQERPGLTRRYTKLANKEAHPWQHWGITLGLPMIVLFDIVVPCIIYYVWYNRQQSWWASVCSEYWSSGRTCPTEQPAEFNENILGSAVASFGVGELWILLARVYRLVKQRDQCAPLLSRARWELDATSWVYAVSMIMALIPFVVGGSLNLPELYLYGPSFLMGFLGILMLITTLVPFKIPIGINSHARGSGLRPFIYYAAEDFIAVDGLQDREFRVRYNERYETNPRFRRFFVHLTILWEFGVLTYIGCVSAVIWTLPFHIAFGLSLGVLFGYIAIWAGITYVWVMIEMNRERLAYEHGDV